jgi:DNA-directed RNA polymerase specialized sigma24 family protein
MTPNTPLLASDPQVDQIVLTFDPQAQAIFERVFRQDQSYATVAQQMDMSVREVKLTVAAILCELTRKLELA